MYFIVVILYKVSKNQVSYRISLFKDILVTLNEILMTAKDKDANASGH